MQSDDRQESQPDGSSQQPGPGVGQQPPVMGQVVPGPYGYPPSYPPVPPARSRWWLWMLLIGVPIVGLAVLTASVSDSLRPVNDLIESRYNRDRWDGTDKIAVIYIEGAIYEAEGGYVKKQIDRVRQDKSIKGVVVRVDSPGGTVSASDFLLHHLKEMRHSREEPLPLVVSMGSVAASGGYYVSMAVEDQPDSIYIEPTSWTGSIGVIIPHYNISGLVGDKIQDESVKSHELKGMGSMLRELTPEERAIYQGLVDDAFARFKEVVLSGRPKLRPQNPGESPDKLDKLATGQVFTARQALEYGLADREGFLDDAIARCIELAGLKDEDVRVVYYKQQTRLFNGLLMEAAQPPLSLNLIHELATPRAYYMCTWLPGMTNATAK